MISAAYPPALAQGLSPPLFWSFTVRLKSYPETKQKASRRANLDKFRLPEAIRCEGKILTQTLLPWVFRDLRESARSRSNCSSDSFCVTRQCAPDHFGEAGQLQCG